MFDRSTQQGYQKAIEAKSHSAFCSFHKLQINL